MSTLSPILSLNDKGPAVKALHAKLAGMGLDLPAPEADNTVFGKGTQLAIAQVQENYRLLVTGNLDSLTETAIERTQKPLQEGMTHRVEGRLLRSDGLPAAGQVVEIVFTGFGAKALDAVEGKTDQNGFYTIDYAPGSQPTNFQIFGQNKKEKEAISSPIFNASPRETIHLIAPKELSVESQSEFARLTGDLLKKAGLESLETLTTIQESSVRKDLTLLHQATSWDARLIGLLATAKILDTEKNGLELNHETVYALLRTGLPSDLDRLARVGTKTVLESLNQASKAKIVSLKPAQVKEAAAAFEAFAARRRLTGKAAGTVSSVGELLDTSAIPTNKIKQFEKVFFEHDGTADELWKAVKTEAGLTDNQINKLKLQGKLAQLTGNNAKVIQSLTEVASSEGKLSNLVDQNFHSEKAWVEQLQKIAGNDDEAINALVPAIYLGKKPQERLEAYAADLARKVRLSFPTKVVEKMVTDKELDLGDAGVDVVAFLGKAATLDFELGKTPVGVFVRDNGAAVFGTGLTEKKKEEVTESIRRLGRIFQITPSDESMKKVSGLGFDSAQDIIALTKNEFYELFLRSYPKAERENPLIRYQADLIYRRSQQVSAVVYNFFTGAKQLNNGVAPNAISGDAQKDAELREKAKAEMIKAFPTLESLFGSLDFCECEHCQSVLSPAAYVVDMLMYLDPNDIKWDHFKQTWKLRHDGSDYGRGKPFEELLKRRPDLQHLPLTCENTHTVLPYIDIVNEILEHFVVHNGSLDASVAHDTGEANSADLIAEPQHLNVKAYERLNAAVYPAHLPFDLWTETVREFANHFDTPLWKMGAAFRTQAALGNRSDLFESRYREALEYLGLSPAEASLFDRAAPISQWQTLFGYPSGNAGSNSALTALRVGKTLARRLNISYVELVELIQTRFVNPPSPLIVGLQKLKLDFHDVLRFFGQGNDIEPFNDSEIDDFKEHLERLSRTFEFDVTDWLETNWDDNVNATTLLLHAPADTCDFGKVILRYGNGDDPKKIDFLKLTLFVRLQKKLGWTIAELDQALTILIPKDAQPLTGNNLPGAFRTALLYLAHLKELSEKLSLSRNNLIKLTTLWGSIPSHGENSLYSQLFLRPGSAEMDPAFDSPVGDYLSNSSKKIANHLLGIQAALNLTTSEINAILEDSGSTAPDADRLLMSTVSRLYRYRVLADGLRLSIGDLIRLKSLSGLDPFHPLDDAPIGSLADDFPLSQTLAFVEAAEAIRESPFKIEDLDYLLAHRFDASSPYQEVDQQPLELIRTLAQELNKANAEFSVSDGEASLTDEWLQQKLALALGAEAADTIIAMHTGTVSYEVSVDNVTPAQTIDATLFEAETDVEISYNEPRQKQTLIYRGFLTTARKGELIAVANRPTLMTTLLNQIDDRVEAFFESELIGFNDIQNLKPQATFTPSDNLDPEADMEEEQRRKLAAAFLPILANRHKNKLITDHVVATLDGDANLTTELLTNPTLLQTNDPIQLPLLTHYRKLEQPGVTAEFHTSADLSGAPISEAVNIAAVDVADAPLTTAAATINSARFTGYFEVPATGAYRLYADFGHEGAKAALSIGRALGTDTPTTISLAASPANLSVAQSGKALELEAGIFYRFEVKASSLHNAAFSLSIMGEGMPKQSWSGLTLYSKATVDLTHTYHTRLKKAVQLYAELEIRRDELLLRRLHDIAYLNPSKLPTSSEPASGDSQQRWFAEILELLATIRLRNDLGGTGESFVDYFALATAINPPGGEIQKDVELIESACKKLAELTRIPFDTIYETAQTLGITPTPGIPVPPNAAWIATLLLREESIVIRILKAAKLCETLGVTPANIASWSTLVDAYSNPQNPDYSRRAEIAREVKHSIKARYDQEAWRQIAQPIFDRLRKKKRDALVAYIVHQGTGSGQFADGFDSMEQLYEYLLIDPGMEPVIKTSRLRLAISSLQLFIQRCFLNLETQVSPAALNNEHWQWMKNYRVWEANRKIFLYPENWLEPEFRDDKTHLFKELEGALFQGDVSNELTEKALYRYLSSFEKLARLDMIAMCSEEDLNDPAASTIHVVGRTYSQPYKYFYRSYANQMWTPWIPVTAEIEGDHIVALVWRGRLHLFWVSYIEKPAPKNSNLSMEKMGKKSGNQMEPDTVVEASLNWSEYFQDEWTSRESSGTGNPVQFKVTGHFDPDTVLIHASKEYTGGKESAVNIHLSGSQMSGIDTLRWQRVRKKPLKGKGRMIPPPETTFRVISKNGNPQITSHVPVPSVPFPNLKTGRDASRYTSSGALSVHYTEKIKNPNGSSPTPTVVTKPILGSNLNHSVLFCSHQRALGSEEIAQLITPFFYQDSRYTFFVEPSLEEKTFVRWEYWLPNIPQQIPSKPDIILVKPGVPIPRPIKNPNGPWVGPRPGPFGPDGPIIDPDVPIDPYAIHKFDTPQDWLTNPGSGLVFGDHVILEQGGIDLQEIQINPNVDTLDLSGQLAPTDILDGGTILVLPNVDDSQILTGAGTINVIGGGGLSNAWIERTNIRDFADFEKIKTGPSFQDHSSTDHL